jgi:hypothetical protein
VANRKIKLNPYTMKLALYFQRLMDEGFQGNLSVPIKGKQFGMLKKEEFVDLRLQGNAND